MLLKLFFWILKQKSVFQMPSEIYYNFLSKIEEKFCRYIKILFRSYHIFCEESWNSWFFQNKCLVKGENQYQIALILANNLLRVCSLLLKYN